jgi:hypothetical protein
MGAEARHGTRWLLRVNNCRASKSEPVSILVPFLPLSPSARAVLHAWTPRHEQPSAPTWPQLASIQSAHFLPFIHREPSPHRHHRLAIASAASSPSPPHPISHSVTSTFPFLIAQQALRWPRTPRRFPRVAWVARLCEHHQPSQSTTTPLQLTTRHRDLSPTPTSHHGVSHSQLHRGLL